MVINQIDVGGSVGFCLIAEHGPPISTYSKAPKPGEIGFQRMQLPTREPVKLVQSVSRLEGKQKLSQLVYHCGRHTFGLPFLVKLS